MRDRRLAALSALLLLLALGAGPALAQRGGLGEGAVVIRDGAVLYEDDHSQDHHHVLSRGDFVVGCTVEFLGEFTYGRFDEDEGRWRVTWVDRKTGTFDHGWMDPDDLATFTYRCCKFACVPFETFKRRWEPCFLEAAEAKLAELEGKKGSSQKAEKPQKAEKSDKSDKAGKADKASGTSRGGERPLTNADVVALAGAGLGDEAVIAKVRQAPAESLDVSTEAILELRRKGLSGAVIQAMVERAGARR